MPFIKLNAIGNTHPKFLNKESRKPAFFSINMTQRHINVINLLIL